MNAAQNTSRERARERWGSEVLGSLAQAFLESRMDSAWGIIHEHRITMMGRKEALRMALERMEDPRQEEIESLIIGLYDKYILFGRPARSAVMDVASDARANGKIVKAGILIEAGVATGLIYNLRAEKPSLRPAQLRT